MKTEILIDRYKAGTTVETPYGSMKFKSQKAAAEFYYAIRSWGEFKTRPEGWRAQPYSLTKAVAYHLAYTTGGFEEVEKVYEAEMVAWDEWDAARTVTDAQRREAVSARYAFAQRREAVSARYAFASLAPKDSVLYREHYDMSYPGYKWGW